MKVTEYLKRWRKKRDEWQINDDADADWRQMSSLLDEHMPVKDDDHNLARGRGFRLLPMIFISLSVAAMVFVTSKVVKREWVVTKKSNTHYHGRHHNKNLSDSSVANNADTNTQVLYADSVSADRENHTKPTYHNKNAETAPAAGNVPAAGLSTKMPPTAPEHNQGGNKVSGSIARSISDTKKTGSLPDNQRNANRSMNNSESCNSGSIVERSADKGAIGIQPQNNGKYYGGKSIALLGEPNQIVNLDIAQLTPLSFKYPFPKLPVPPLAKNNTKNKSSGASSGTHSPAGSALEWGLLVGVNSPGSFTPKKQNANFYGSLSIDPFAGAYATYHFGDKWGAGLQLRVLSPSVVTGSYQVPHQIQRDTITGTAYRTQADSRKLYSVQIPVYAAYQLTNLVGIKAGPMLSFPIKQFSTAKTDSTSVQLLTSSRYDQKFDFGLTGGATFRYKRFSLDAAYLKGLTTHTVKGDSLSYKKHNSQLQITIGIQLGGKKR